MKAEKRKIVLLLMTVMLLSLVTGCGGQKVKDESQIKDDLIERELNVVYINEVPETFDITELTIDRRNTEDDFDEVYVSVQLDNEYYQINESYALYYYHYDEGGWYLENYEITDYSSSAKKSIVSDEEIKSILSSQFDFCEINERNQIVDENGVFCDTISFVGELWYECWSVNVEGEYTLMFMDDMWIHDCSFASAEVDWTDMLGKWSYQYDSGHDSGYFHDVNLTISNVAQSEADSVLIEYNGNCYSYYKSLDKTDVNKTFSEVKEVRLEYTTEEVFGIKIEVPNRIGSIWIPWRENTSLSHLNLYAHIDKGLYVPANELDYKEVYFTKE